jgi:hypothetical protein
MTAFTAQPKPFILLIVCATFVMALAGLAAGLRPAQAASVTVPTPQAVPVAPAAAAATRPAAAPSALAAVPQPVPVAIAPGTPAVQAQFLATEAGTVAGLPADGGPMPVLALAAAGLLVGSMVVLRRTGLALRRAAC